MQYLTSLQLILVQDLFWWAIMSSSIVILLFFFLVTSRADVNITTRSQWGAVSPKKAPLHIQDAVPWVVIHHSDGNPGCSGKPCSEIVKIIQRFHMVDRNWDDIGYNFLVGPTGEVFEGRGWGVVGAHATKYNSKSIGICLIGKYHNVTPPENQLDAVKDLIRTGVQRGSIKESYNLIGHKQVRPTNCPGDNLYAIIKKWPRFTESVPEKS